MPPNAAITTELRVLRRAREDDVAGASGKNPGSAPPTGLLLPVGAARRVASVPRARCARAALGSIPARGGRRADPPARIGLLLPVSGGVGTFVTREVG